ncbi:MAG: LptF/LptG family permease [Luteitalea sp.]|nr:LptF/LptG family permease [Luteitalea sp.]
MLRILDRYLIREATAPTLLAVLIFTFVLEVPIILRDLEPLLTAGISWGLAGRILLLLLPQALAITVPMALMVGLLVALGRFSADRESVAIQACGISLYRLLRPVGLLAIAATLVSGYVMIEALPKANIAYLDILTRIVANDAQRRIRPRVFFEDFPNMVLYARDVQPGSAGWQGLVVADSRNNQKPQIITAERGRLVVDREARRVDLALEQGVVHRLEDRYYVDAFQTRTVSLDPRTIFSNSGVARNENSMTIAELRELASLHVKEGLSPHNLIMAIHQKFSLPVAALVFALLALGLGVTDRKDAKQNSFVIGLGVFFAYYLLMYLGRALARGGQIPPELAMWIPNIVLGLAGIVLLGFRVRGKELGAEIRLLTVGTLARRFARVRPLPPLAPRATGSTNARATPSKPQPPVLLIRVPRGLFTRTGILDRYVASRYLRVFGLTMAAMLGLFYIAEFIELSEKLFKGQATGVMLLRYFALSTPQKVYWATALGSLVGAIGAIGLLTRTSELIAMRACGVSLYRASVPLLVFGMLWSILLFGLEETILPSANREAKKLYDEIRDRAPRTTNVLQRQWLAGANNRLYHYAYYDPQDRRFGDLTIYDFAENQSSVSRRTYTAYAQYGVGPELQQRRRGAWYAGAGWVREFSDGRMSRYETFSNWRLPIESPDYFTQEDVNTDVAERLGYRELSRYISELRTAGFNVTSLAVQLHRKLAFPFVTVIMTLIAIPFAITTGRRGALYGIGAGIVLAIVYQTVQSAAAAVGSAGMLPPLLAAWAPNLLFASSAAYLLLTVRT